MIALLRTLGCCIQLGRYSVYFVVVSVADSACAGGLTLRHARVACRDDQDRRHVERLTATLADTVRFCVSIEAGTLAYMFWRPTVKDSNRQLFRKYHENVKILQIRAFLEQSWLQSSPMARRLCKSTKNFTWMTKCEHTMIMGLRHFTCTLSMYSRGRWSAVARQQYLTHTLPRFPESPVAPETYSSTLPNYRLTHP